MRHKKTTDTKEVRVITGEKSLHYLEELLSKVPPSNTNRQKITYDKNHVGRWDLTKKIDKNEHIITRCEKLDNQWLLEVETMNFKRYFKNQPPYEKGDVVDLTIFLNYIDTLK